MDSPRINAIIDAVLTLPRHDTGNAQEVSSATRRHTPVTDSLPPAQNDLSQTGSDHAALKGRRAQTSRLVRGTGWLLPIFKMRKSQ